MAVTFANDIRPKFRDQDISCMARRGVHLDDATWMCDPEANHGFDDHGNARRVHAALSAGRMPPDGAWSDAWLDVYADWMSGGFPA